MAQRATVGIRVLSATGRAVPNLRLTLTAAGVQGLPDELRTNAAGEARVSFTPATATDVRLTVKATVASTLPELFAASTQPPPATPSASPRRRRRRCRRRSPRRPRRARCA